MPALIENISELMKQKGWNGKTLAAKSGQKMSAIYNILNGRSKRPSADKIDAIARAFGVNSSAILYGMPDRPDYAEVQIDWDGLLYGDSMAMVREILAKRQIKFSNREEEKDKVVHYTTRVYNYARKRKETKPDYVFAEDIISQG